MCVLLAFVGTTAIELVSHCTNDKPPTLQNYTAVIKKSNNTKIRVLKGMDQPKVIEEVRKQVKAVCRKFPPPFV